MGIVESLNRIEAWGARSGLSLKLRQGASEEALVAAEAALGRPLPPDYRALLRFADGQADDPDFTWLPGCNRLAPIDAVVAQAAEERALAEEMPPPDEETEDGTLRLGRFRVGRLPIAGTAYWDGDETHLDFEPGSKGTGGQLITMVTECDFVVLGASLEDALARCADALEAGKLAWVGDELIPTGATPHQVHPAELFVAPRG